MKNNNMIWNLLLVFTIISLFLGNFNHITMAEDLDEPNVFFEEISFLLAEKKLGNEKMEQSVTYLLNDKKQGGDLKELQIKDFTFVDEKVRLEVILISEEYLDSLMEFSNDVKVENHYKSLAQVLIPIDLIQSLSQEDFILYIRKPIKAYPLDIVSEGVNRIGADLVHAEGVFGAGTKIAIIDLGFQNYLSNPELPSERIAEVYSFRADGDIECGEVHGCACAEIILDVAPQADLYLYNFNTISELNDAVSRAIFVGADVISFSIGYVNINDYDGIGYPGIGDVCGIVDNARANGVLFVTSAGNQAERHYEGIYTDNDGDYFHEFDPPYETLVLDYISAGEIVHVALSWDDWPGSDQNYDLLLFDSNLNLVGHSGNVQSGSQPPVEMIAGYVLYGDYYQVVIYRYSATVNVHFELYSFYNNFLTSNCPESSLSCPADAYGSMTAGATYWQNDNLETFSSRGPTNDGRTKPDVTAPDYVSTWTYGPGGFSGTSASSPHTAGAAALLKSADPTLTANILQSKLESTALDLGPGGKDNSYGSGRINVWAAFNTINQAPIANFIYSPSSPTTLDIIQFTDTSTDSDGTIVSWSWDFGDDSTSTVQNPTHQYADDGIYTVTLTVIDDGGRTDDYEDDIPIGNAPPNAYIDSITPNPALLGEIVGFIGYGTDHDGTIIDWEWNSSIDGFLSNQPSFQTNSLSLGDHTISFRVKDDNNDWSNNETQILIINAPPVANFIFDPSDPSTQNIIYFNSTSYDSDGSIVNWTWDLGDSTYVYGERVTYQYVDNGTFSVVLLVRDNLGAEDTFSDDVVVSNVPPNALFTYSPSSPTTLDIIQFTDTSTDIDGTIVSWLWDFDDENTSTEQNPTHQYGDDGVYLVSLTVTDDDGGTDDFNVDVYVSQIPPEANFTYDPIIPVPYEIIQFTDTSTDPDGTIVSWSWDFGDGNTSSEQYPTHSYQNGGSYTVTLNVTDDDGLTDQFSQEIFINTIPMAIFFYTPENPHTFEDISFNDESSDLYGPIESWLWDFGDGNFSTEQNPIHSYAEHISYDVSLEVTDEYGLTNNTSQQITVINRNPTADFEYYPDNPTDIENVAFSDISTDVDGIIVAWLWDFGDDSISTVQNPIHQYGDDGTYTVTLNVTDDDGDTDEISYQITISNVRPTSNFNCVPDTPGVNEIIQFFDLSTDPDGTIVSWLWDFDDGNTSTEQNPQYMYSSFETYSVALTVTDDDGDTDEVSYQIVTKMTYEEVVMPGNSVVDLENETGTSIAINATSQTNITIEKYSGNPTHENMINDITSVNNHVNITVENESSIVWPIEIRLFYSQDDLNNSNIDEDQLFGIYFWDDTIEEWTLNNDTGVNTEYNQNGYEGYCWANFWHLTLLAPGGDAEPPTKVTGLTVTDAKDGKLDLAWNAATDNVAVDHYNIYRNSGFLTVTTSTSYQNTGLTNDQSYTYEVSAVDTSGNEGERSDSASGISTGSPPPPPPPPPPPSQDPPIVPPPTPPDDNDDPTADANGPYYEIINVQITFDGSGSTDDGTIESYDWDFGDGNIGIGVSPTHIYEDDGNFTVTLTVTDDDGATDTGTTYAVITGKPNLPPSKPLVHGYVKGNKDIDYNYTAVSTDQDNDTIKYTFDWGDGTNTTTGYLLNGTEYTEMHNWTNAGKYILKVNATDEHNASSETAELIVLIDARYVGDIGYFIDDNSDGIFDSFYSNETGNETLFELQENGDYKIDINGDDEYDYAYNPVTGAITSLKGKETTETPEVFWIMIIGIIVAITIIAIIILLYKKK